MSTYVLMKLLESAPARYDLGIRLLTLGAVDRTYDRLARHVATGQRMLEIGCGTGALTIRAAQRGACVKAIDINAQMLDIAQHRALQANLASCIEFCEMGVAELSGEPPESFDVVASGLCLSELTEDEREFALKEARRVLKPGGCLLLADEARPQGALRVVYWIIRIPLAALTYLMTQTTTRAVSDLPRRVRQAGFDIQCIHYSGLQDFVELIARKPGEAQ